MKKQNLLFLLVGASLFISSALVLTHSTHHFTARELTRLWTGNWLGLIFISEFVARWCGGRSLFSWLFRGGPNLLIFALVCVLGGAVIEGLGQWVGKLWYYPFFSLHGYQHVVVPGFIIYMTTITAVYLAAKAAADKLFGRHRLASRDKPFEKRLYLKFFWLGPLLLATAVALSYQLYHSVGGYFFNVNAPVDFHISFWKLTLAPAGIWFLCEYVQHRRRQASFIKSLLSGYLSPLIAIFAATAVVGLSMELINLHFGYWVYVNWPMQQIVIFHLPAVMILIAWPIQFVMWLSVYRVLIGGRSIDVWSPGSSVFKKRTS